MLSGDIAKYQIEDRIRDAELDRPAARRVGAAVDAGRGRKVGSSVMSVVGGLRVHATPKELPVTSRLETT